MALGRRRILAWLIDCACILVWVAVTALIGVPLYLAGIIASTGMLRANLIGAFVMVVPVVIAAAWCESRSGSATPGKNALGLRVSLGRDDRRFPVAMVRNLLKIGLPWILGHAAVYALAATGDSSAGVPAGIWVLTAAAYLIPIVFVVSLLLGEGRTPYDRLTRTRVELRPER